MTDYKRNFQCAKDDPIKAAAQYGALERIGRDLLCVIGLDPYADPDIKDTPARWAKWWQEFINYDPGKVETAFESSQHDQMVVVRNMQVWSLCEHHLLPFSANITIGYIADKKILGLSKFARIAHKHAHKLQVQERLVQDIANEIEELTGSKSIAVVAKGQHLCMVMRGIKTDGEMVTSIMRGVFRKSGAARSEFLALADGR